MIEKIKYPAKCTVQLTLKNGNRFKFSTTVLDENSDIVARLYTLSLNQEPTSGVDEHQTTINFGIPDTSVSETPKKKRGRPKGKKTDRPQALELDRVREAREKAQERARESEEIEACKSYPEKCTTPDCPRLDRDCYRRRDGEKETERLRIAKTPKHSGELCRGKIAECEFFCTSDNCVFYKKPLTHWAICNGKLFPDECGSCSVRIQCLLVSPPMARLCKIETAQCHECANPYCGYSLA